MNHWVYEIVINNERRYIGRTNDIRRREYEHNRQFKKGYNKLLYKNLSKIYTEHQIELKPIKTFLRKTDAKRYECFLILQDYFNNKKLWQSIPRIGD